MRRAKSAHRPVRDSNLWTVQYDQNGSTIELAACNKAVGHLVTYKPFFFFFFFFIVLPVLVAYGARHIHRRVPRL